MRKKANWVDDMGTQYVDHSGGRNLVSVTGLYALSIGLALFWGAVMFYGLTGQVWTVVGIVGVLLFWAGLGLALVGYLVERRRGP